MKNRLQTTRVLLIDTLLIVILGIAFVMANIYLTQHVNSSLKSVDQTMDAKLKVVLGMTNVVRERSASMLKIYSETDDWKMDDEFIRFHRLALDFINLRQQLLDSDLTDEEIQLLNKALAIIRTTEPLQNDIVERIHSGDMANVSNDISRKDIPKEIEILGIFEQLTQQIMATSSNARREIKKRFQRAVLFVALVSFLIVIGLAMLMRHSLKKIQKIEMDLLVEADNLGWEATHDPLTNIYNRRWLKHKVNHLFDKQQNADRSHTLIYIDMDGFKEINDKYGHVAGDNYLQAVCRKIESCIRQNDIFARIGGDEFAVLLENCELLQAGSIAEHILQSVNNLTCYYEEQPLSASCSIGIYEFTSDLGSFEEIIRQADALCYKSKKAGKNRISSRKIA
jgi:diguanylate cyclase (GGDEF)-like protein